MPYKLIWSTIFIVAFGSASCNATTYWKPDPKFTIEGSEYLETLTFISGFAYALSYSSRKLNENNLSNFYCLPDGVSMDSKLLIDLANESLEGDSTSEDVSAAVINGLATKYPCSTK